MNIWNIAGRVGSDPEMRTTKSGMTVTTFSVAIDERVKKGDSFEKHTEWARCVTFGKKAEWLGSNMTKGDIVACYGKSRTRSYQGQDGATRSRTELLCDDVDLFFTGRRGSVASGPGEAQSSGFDDDDVPF